MTNAGLKEIIQIPTVTGEYYFKNQVRRKDHEIRQDHIWKTISGFHHTRGI